MAEDAIYVNAYKGGEGAKAPKVKGKIYGNDLKKLIDTFPEGCDFAIFKNANAGEKKNIKGKEITVSDFAIKFSPPFKPNKNSASKQRTTDDSDF